MPYFVLRSLSASVRREWMATPPRADSQSAARFPGAAQGLGQFGVNLVELADALFAVDLDRKRDRGPQQQAPRCGFRDELVGRLAAEGLAQRRWQRDNPAAGDGQDGFHPCSMAAMQIF